MHITFVGAMEPLSKVGDRTRVGVIAETPETAVLLSNFLASEIATGGPRNADFAALLATPEQDLKNKRGCRDCAD